MDSREFVDRVDHLAGRLAVDDVLSNLHQPPGRRPSEHLVRLSEWFNKLDETDKAAVRDVIAETASAAMFGIYCILDGSRTVLDDAKRERLDLIYKGDSGDLLIASTSSGEGAVLHEMRGDLV